MKGLLIKDFKLLKAQQKFFLLVLFIAIVVEMFSGSSSSFLIGYLSFMAILFTLSSISYDEFDNGNAFLFSLPITRKSYVIEKYGLGLILGSSFWAFGTLIVILKEVIANKYISIDTIVAAFSILPVIFVILAVTLPFQLKFGGEKGRIAMISTLVIVFMVGIIMTKTANALNINLGSLFIQIATFNKAVLILSIIGFTLLALFLSYRISLSIMKKKEF
ncbi:MAG: ABC-2 transporter permease [Acutalibacteraceae bacterium]|nr:ABC-2 transporter permease [Acutalibacteraceae bacterium]